MEDPITPCRFRQFAERRRELVGQYREGIILSEDLGFAPWPDRGYVIFTGRAECRGGIIVDAKEYLQIVSIPSGKSFKDGVVSLETYGYNASWNHETNICRFDGPHSASHPDRFPSPDTEDHTHHDYQHVHISDPSLTDGEKVLRTWPGNTPTLFGFIMNIHEWRFDRESQVGGHEITFRPFET